jgi:ATP-dependent RNA helicase DeaD
VESDERDENGPTKSQHVVHVLPQGDARVAGVITPQLDRIDADVPGVQLLVLVPSADSAAWLARLVNGGRADTASLLLPVTAPGRAARLISLGARAIAAAPAEALALVRGSALKLDAVRSLVLVDLNDLLDTSATDLATLLGELPKEAERIAVAREADDAVRDFTESHMRRARRLAHDPLSTFAGSAVQYIVATGSEREAVLRRVFDLVDPAHATVVADDASREEASRALATLGYPADGIGVRLTTGDVAEKEPLVILFGGETAQRLSTILASSPAQTIVIVSPERLAEFLRLSAGRATPLALSPAAGAARVAEDLLRDEVRAQLSGRSLHREVLALEPLLADSDAVQVAAAVLRLLESDRARLRKPAARAAAAPAVTVPNEQRETIGGTFTKLFLNVGERDGAQKGDLVGAITGESGVTPQQIGKIDLRDTHSVVEIAPDVAEKVMAALNGTTIRGRSIMARVDRGPSERFERGERDAAPGGSGGADRPMRSERSGGFAGSRDRGAAPRSASGSRGERSGGGGGSFRGGDRSKGGFRGERSGGGYRGTSPRDGGSERGGSERGGSERGGERGGLRGARPSGGASRFDRGGARSGPPRAGGSSRGPSSGAPRPSGGFNRGDSGPPRERSGGFRRDDGPPRGGARREDEGRTPRAIGESSEWSERGERLKNSRGRRSDG